MSFDDRKILEMLEPLVHDEMKVWSLMGGEILEECQSILYQWKIWLRNHWQEDENILTKNVGKYSVWFNVFSKNVILYYALKGYRFFAETQGGDSEGLMMMAVKAHAIEIGPQYKKPKILPVKPLRININLVSAFQRADDLFANPQNYLKRDKNNIVIIDKSGWIPDEGEESSPIILWQILAAYETNLISYQYFVKAKKLSEEKKEKAKKESAKKKKGTAKKKATSKKVKKDDRFESHNDTVDRYKGDTEEYYSERLKNIFRPDS